jgi:hypothetical protein
MYSNPSGGFPSGKMTYGPFILGSPRSASSSDSDSAEDTSRWQLQPCAPGGRRRKRFFETLQSGVSAVVRPNRQLAETQKKANADSHLQTAKKRGEENARTMCLGGGLAAGAPQAPYSIAVFRPVECGGRRRHGACVHRRNAQSP